MMNPISISVYPLFGGWRAECKSCGAYGNSDDSKYKSQIAVALENLAKNQYAYTDKCNTCEHKYGNYKPRVTCYIDYANLPFIKETFSKQGDENSPRILVDTKINLEVFNAPKLTHEWSAYSRLRYKQLQEDKAAKLEIERLNSNLSSAIAEAKSTVDALVERHAISYWQYIIYAIICVAFILLVSLIVGSIFDIGGSREFLLRLNEACLYGLCV